MGLEVTTGRVARSRSFDDAFLGGLTGRLFRGDSLGKGGKVIPRTLPFCTKGGFCVFCGGMCPSMHVITTPPSSVNGFNNRASG